MIPVPDIVFARENAAYRLEDARLNLKVDLGAAYQSAALQHRILGICALLIDYDKKTFASNCARAGQYRLELLEQLPDAIGSAKWKCPSQNTGFCDALAALDINTAKKIARLSPQKYHPDFEYEEDFLFYHFLHNILLDSNDKTLLASIIEKWAEVINGNPNGYYEVCRALLEQKSFELSFENLIESRLKQLERYKGTINFDSQRFSAEGAIFIEGIAVLRIAEMQGLTIKDSYQLIPEAALFSKTELQAWGSTP